MTQEEVDAACKLYTLIELLDRKHLTINHIDNTWFIFDPVRHSTLGAGVTLITAIQNATKGMTI